MGLNLLQEKIITSDLTISFISERTIGRKVNVSKCGFFLNNPENFFKNQSPCPYISTTVLLLFLLIVTFPLSSEVALFFFSRLTLPSSSRLYNKAASSLNPWASTPASSPTLAASSCPPLTPRCPPTSSSTRSPAWPCSPLPSRPLRSQWPASLSRMPQVCATAFDEKMSDYKLSFLNNGSMLSRGFCRFSGPKPCHGQLWADSRRHQRSGDHADHQQSQPHSSPCLSILLQRCSRKPSGDHPHHIRHGTL